MINQNNLSTLYVSQKYGDDEATGFYKNTDIYNNGPLKSIERAVWRVKQMRHFGFLQPVTISVLDDEYFIEKPVVIDSSVWDGGCTPVTDGRLNITIEPYKKTLISGGERITGFSEDTYNGVRCFSADVPKIKDGFWFTDFYVDGKRAKVTRYPENDTLKPESVDNNATTLITHSKWFIAKDEDLKTIAKFKNFGDCFITYRHYWVDEHTPIESYDLATGKIVCKYPSRFSVSDKYPQSALNYIIENVAESFKNPGEWYLDRETCKVYYIPENDEQTPENIVVYVPVSDKFFIVSGKEDFLMQNITIRGFEMAYTKGDYASRDEDGELYASDIQSMCNAFGNVEFEFAANCALENCEIHSTGLHAVKLGMGAKRIRIENNNLHNIGAGGILSGGAAFGENEKYFNHDNVFSNNIITGLGERYYASCGILITHSFNNRVSHNEISDLFYSGISCGWVWGYFDSISDNNIIEYNHIHNLGKGFLSDMGGIYVLGKQCGTILRNNLIHDVLCEHYGGWGLYTDEGSSYVTIENNIVYNVSCDCYEQHFGNMNTVRNNIFVKAKEAVIKYARSEMQTGIIFERNIMVSEGKAFYGIGYGEGNGGYMHMVSAHDNLLFDISGENTVVEIGDRKITLDGAQAEFGFEENSILENPLFKDYENNDFTFEDNSPAYKIGFKPINIKEIGVIR